MEKRQLELRTATKSLDVLAQIQERSLPSNPELARSRYQAWLLGLINQAGLKGPNVDSGEPQGHRGIYNVFTFAVRGRGTPAQVTELLYAFYSAGHLHKIRSMTLNPLSGSDQLDLTLTIEALSLRQASRADELTTAPSQSLALASLADYQPLVRRNVFGAGDADAAAKSTVLTAITSDVSGVREAWFRVGKAGQTRVLRAGDTLAIDMLAARLLDIGLDGVMLELEGQQRTLTIGKSLAEASPLPSAPGVPLAQ
jgi:hypothetical protein